MISSPAIPSLPPNVFVPLIPLASNSPYYSPASLKFSCPVNVVASSTCPASASPSSQSPRIPGTSELGDHRTRPSRTRSRKLVELRMYCAETVATRSHSRA
ncbi:hypothetical protein BGW80DRAFT_1349589 [Lactifluus volemus]|nr:hypothetical protein BGW80DRAFT_1349589 [Lactifluus volemus]